MQRLVAPFVQRSPARRCRSRRAAGRCRRPGARRVGPADAARGGRARGAHALRRARRGAGPLQGQLAPARERAGPRDHRGWRGRARARAGCSTSCRGWAVTGVLSCTAAAARTAGWRPTSVRRRRCTSAGAPGHGRAGEPRRRGRGEGRGIDAALDPFVPLYLHLLSIPSDAFPLPRHLHGEHLQAAMLEALTALFAALARRATMLVLLEDWHWADEASRDALRRLAEMVGARPAGRRDQPARAWRPGRVRRDRGAHPARPARLAASAAIMRAVLGVERVSDALARARARAHRRAIRSSSSRSAAALLEEQAVVVRGRRGGGRDAASKRSRCRTPCRR